MKKVFLLLTAMVAMSVNAQVEVNSFTPGANEGVTYCLPDTRIEVTLNATCIKRTPGEFCRYAERYLRTKNAIEEAGITWKLDGITVNTIGTPSPDKRYTIKLNNSKASNILLCENGVIESINTRANHNAEPQEIATNDSKGRIDASQYMTEEMLQATSSAKMAELVAKEIYTIRESKLAITRGQSDNMPKDGQAMQLMLEELDKQEHALMSLFMGETDTIRYCKSVIIDITEGCDINKEILLRFSRKLGFLDKENLAGEPVYYNLHDLKSVNKTEDDSKKKTIKKEGICYNVPGKAEIEVYTRSRKYLKAELEVAQLGTTEVLSRSLFNKSNNTKVLFDTTTGAIISIEK